MTFWETGKTVLLMDDEDFMIMNDDGAARGFGFGIRGCGGGGIGLAEVGGVRGGVISVRLAKALSAVVFGRDVHGDNYSIELSYC